VQFINIFIHYFYWPIIEDNTGSWESRHGIIKVR